MIILNATFLEGEFFLWGEMPEEPETLAVKRPRNKSNLRGNPADPKPLRYDAGIEKLSSGLKEIGFDFKPIKKFIRSMTIWLPTVDDQPVPSSPPCRRPRGHRLPRRGSRNRGAPWKAPGTVSPRRGGQRTRQNSPGL